MASKDPITCHVLDTTAGRPASGITVRLEGPQPASSSGSATSVSSSTYEAITDSDGRVKTWKSPGPVLTEVMAAAKGATRWTLRFDTEAYFGEGKTFFPEATVVFRVEEGQGYHVPLLLSPFSYTTYRGS